MTNNEHPISWVLNHQWIKLDDRLPPIGEPVLVSRDEGIYIEIRYEKDSYGYQDEYGFDVDEIGECNKAHKWMRIPCLAKVGDTYKLKDEEEE